MAKKVAQGVDQAQDQEPGFWAKVGKVLRDFGMGRRSVMEGGVGAFVLGGAGEWKPNALDHLKMSQVPIQLLGLLSRRFKPA